MIKINNISIIYYPYVIQMILKKSTSLIVLQQAKQNKMKTLISTLLLMHVINICYSQVGINTLNPNASLEVVASNQATPNNTDGILIPRIDAFPATIPTVNQDAMLVYLTTTSGSNTPGFYYWNNATTSWLPISSTAIPGWELTGNLGTVNGTNFIGTTDSQAFDIRTNDVIHHRITTLGQLEFLNTGNSIYIGENTGASDDTTLDKLNVFIGNNVGPSITTGVTATYQARNNTAIGYEAYNSATTGYANSVLGYRSGASLTTGRWNSAFGYGSLENATAVEYNTAIGYDALQNVDGPSNTAIGFRALAGSLNPLVGTARNNTAIGEGAGRRIQDGRNNIYLGKDTDEFNTNGSRNTIIGTDAGAAIGSFRVIDGRILIGYEAGFGSGGTDNTLYIENSRSNTPLIYGEFDNDIVRIGGQLQVVFNDDTTSGAIYSFPTTDGTTGQVLTTDGAGTINWPNATGGSTDADWFEAGTTTAPDAITDNIFTNGNVGIGDNTPDANLDIEGTGDITMILNADTDNSGESDNPLFRLIQDGGGTTGNIGLIGNSGTQFTGSSSNDLFLSTTSSASNIQIAPNNNLVGTFRANGQFQLNDYTTATSHTGTATFYLRLMQLTTTFCWRN